MIRTGTRKPDDSISTSPYESSLESEKLEKSKYLKVFERQKSPVPNLPVHQENIAEPFYLVVFHKKLQKIFNSHSTMSTAIAQCQQP